MVRLRAKSTTETRVLVLFQFLHGAIKSTQVVIQDEATTEFQFLHGAIKRLFGAADSYGLS